MVAAMNFDNLVAVLAVAAAVPLILAAVPRVRVPGPVLEIIAGIVLGPAVLDLVKPDQAVRLVSTIGLAFLLFLAGLEIDVRHFRGPRARLTGLALGLSALLALIIGIVLDAAGVVESPLLVGIILMATSLGLIVPILEDAGVAEETEVDSEVAEHQTVAQRAGFAERVHRGHAPRLGGVILGDPGRPHCVGMQALKDRVRREQRGDIFRLVGVDRRLPPGEDRIQLVRLVG
jgi:hypothetical protein